jgi:hypothetical protein
MGLAVECLSHARAATRGLWRETIWLPGRGEPQVPPAAQYRWIGAVLAGSALAYYIGSQASPG